MRTNEPSFLQERPYSNYSSPTILQKQLLCADDKWTANSRPSPHGRRTKPTKTSQLDLCPNGSTIYIRKFEAPAWNCFKCTPKVAAAGGCLPFIYVAHIVITLYATYNIFYHWNCMYKMCVAVFITSPTSISFVFHIYILHKRMAAGIERFTNFVMNQFLFLLRILKTSYTLTYTNNTNDDHDKDNNNNNNTRHIT